MKLNKTQSFRLTWHTKITTTKNEIIIKKKNNTNDKNTQSNLSNFKENLKQNFYKIFLKL